jgi:hypothetical protein
MTHNKHTTNNSILELDNKTIDYYLDLVKDWQDPLGPLNVQEHYNHNSNCKVDVVREDVHEMGTKGRWGDLLVQSIENDTIVYVAPRVGYAAMSLAYLGKKYKKRVILFCPASKQISDHQAVAASYGAELRFLRIAAMPNLNLSAEKFARENGFFFAPFGLRHPMVTAAGVKCVVDNLSGFRGSHALWSVISTGVLGRALQIGLGPEVPAYLVAVARNIKDGEKGPAEIMSHPFPFLKDENKDYLPPFPCVASYDAKAWRYIKEIDGKKPLFWNVAKEPVVTDEAKWIAKGVKSAREWGDKRDLLRPMEDINGV